MGLVRTRRVFPALWWFFWESWFYLWMWGCAKGGPLGTARRVSALVWVLTAWLASAIALVPHALAQAPTLTILDPVPGRTSSRVTSVSADGRTLVGSSTGVGIGNESFAWSAGSGYQEIALGHSILVGSRATSVSSDGSVVAGWAQNAPGTTNAYRYSNGTYSVLPLPGGYAYAGSYGVSGDGSVIVGEIGRPTGGRRAMRWTAATGMVDVGRPRASDLASDFTGISRDGATAIGKSTGPTESTDAFTWTQEGGWRLLPVFPGTTARYDSFPSTTNSDGSVVVGSFDATGALSRAVVWRNHEPIDLGTFGPNFAMFGTGGSEDGRVIVGARQNIDPGGRVEATVWLDNSGPILLRQYLENQGVAIPANWDLETCMSVTPDGRTIVGRAVHRVPNDTYSTPFIVTIPTPGVAVLATIAGLARPRRRARPVTQAL